MASHKSAKKRIRTSERKRVINKRNDSKVKTLVKKTLTSKDKTEIEKLYKEAISFIDKNTTKGNLHRNTAARKKSALSKHLNKVTAVK
ncbi:MAG: 30S ribosomal protein S20 [Ignavibacteriales bacterium]|jgi:small subunit ribosomal protein S20|nr:30S ribosomal protein S20 [Ignavibacteriales bacterium]